MVGALEAGFYTLAKLGEVPSLLVVYLAIAVSAGTALWILVLRRSLRRSHEFYSQLGPRMKDVDVHGLRGVTVLFDNGLVYQAADYGLRFSVAGPVAAFTARNALLQRRGLWRMKTVSKVGRNQGPDTARVALESLREKLGSRWAWAFLFRRPDGRPADPVAADWAVVALFAYPRQAQTAHRIVDQLDAIRGFLEDLRIRWLPTGLPGMA